MVLYQACGALCWVGACVGIRGADGRTFMAVKSETAASLSWDVTRILLAVVTIGGLIAATFWVLRPFLPALIWATMIVVATWPMMRAVQRRLGGRRVLAVMVMTAGMVVIVVAPIAVGIVVVVQHAAGDVVEWSKSLSASVAAGPPAGLSDLPLVGKRLASEWEKIASARPEDLAARVRPYLADVGRWIVGRREASASS